MDKPIKWHAIKKIDGFYDVVQITCSETPYGKINSDKVVFKTMGSIKESEQWAKLAASAPELLLENQRLREMLIRLKSLIGSRHGNGDLCMEIEAALNYQPTK